MAETSEDRAEFGLPGLDQFMILLFKILNNRLQALQVLVSSSRSGSLEVRCAHSRIITVLLNRIIQFNFPFSLIP